MAERQEGQPNFYKEKIAEGKVVMVLGGGGLVGSRFIEMYGGANFIAPTSLDLDIKNSEEVRRNMDRYSPDILINFAAFTDVRAAEEEHGQFSKDCFRVNVDGVRNILSTIPEKTHFIQISTNEVFFGGSRDVPYFRENHPVVVNPGQLTWYGYCKAYAETIIFENLKLRSTIVRISNPTRGEYDKKLDYLRKPLKLYAEGKLYPLFNDQAVTITYIDEACELVARIIERNQRGVFHATSVDSSTPYRIISELINKLEEPHGKKVMLKQATVKRTEERVRYRSRPLDVLDTERRLGIRFSCITDIVAKVLGDYLK